jgi:hypothetical protein
LFSQLGKGEEAITAFVPARVANRQQLLANINNQQGLNRPTIIQSEQNQPWSTNSRFSI